MDVYVPLSYRPRCVVPCGCCCPPSPTPHNTQTHTPTRHQHLEFLDCPSQDTHLQYHPPLHLLLVPFLRCSHPQDMHCIGLYNSLSVCLHLCLLCVADLCGARDDEVLVEGHVMGQGIAKDAAVGHHTVLLALTTTTTTTAQDTQGVRGEAPSRAAAGVRLSKFQVVVHIYLCVCGTLEVSMGPTL